MLSHSKMESLFCVLISQYYFSFSLTKIQSLDGLHKPNTYYFLQSLVQSDLQIRQNHSQNYKGNLTTPPQT